LHRISSYLVLYYCSTPKIPRYVSDDKYTGKQWGKQKSLTEVLLMLYCDYICTFDYKALEIEIFKRFIGDTKNIFLKPPVSYGLLSFSRKIGFPAASVPSVDWEGIFNPSTDQRVIIPKRFLFSTFVENFINGEYKVTQNQAFCKFVKLHMSKEERETANVPLTPGRKPKGKVAKSPEDKVREATLKSLKKITAEDSVFSTQERAEALKELMEMGLVKSVSLKTDEILDAMKTPNNLAPTLKHFLDHHRNKTSPKKKKKTKRKATGPADEAVPPRRRSTRVKKQKTNSTEEVTGTTSDKDEDDVDDDEEEDEEDEEYTEPSKNNKNDDDDENGSGNMNPPNINRNRTTGNPDPSGTKDTNETNTNNSKGTNESEGDNQLDENSSAIVAGFANIGFPNDRVITMRDPTTGKTLRLHSNLRRPLVDRVVPV